MFLFCLLFGSALIAQTQSPGDGNWFWYATFLQGGHRLYSEMHLALQPLFVLETSYFFAMLGKGWIASKIPAILHLVAYCVALWILAGRSSFSDFQKAVIIGCGFFFPLGFEAYRFDDYHVLADCFQLYALIALLALPQVLRLRNQLFLVSVLGLLCGLSLTTRLNDGAALFVGVSLGVLVLARRQRVLSLALLGFAAACTLVAVVWLTGDSLRDYATYSIFHAAGSKGGAGNVLAYPLMLPLNTARWLLQAAHNDLLSAYIVLCGVAWASFIGPFVHKRGRRELAMAAAGFCAVILPLPWMYNELLCRSQFVAPFALLGMAAIGTILACVLGALIVVRFFRSLASANGSWDRREILLLIPIGQLASGSMSTGGVHYGLYGTLGVLVVLISICPPFRPSTDWLRSFSIPVLAILVVTTAIYKFKDPYSWHTYRENRLFVNRTVYHHPIYGPMIIDRDMLAFIQPVCSEIEPTGPHPELLSLPFPYANYFCGIPPWHGYVQTFYDTSSKETIDTLMGQLASGPPPWILYQRQLATLALHELAYNQSRPLEHRYLDQMIEQKIQQGQWRVAYSSSYDNSSQWDNHWMLIRTSP